jgi:hypothetical protein
VHAPESTECVEKGHRCLQVAMLDMRVRAEQAHMAVWGTAKRSWTSWVCAKLDPDVAWLSFFVLVLTLGAFRPVHGHAVLPCMVDLAFACTLLLRAMRASPAAKQRLVLQRRLQADMLSYVRFQYVYFLAVYLCQIPRVLEELAGAWERAGLHRALTIEDLGLYLIPQTDAVLWAIIERLVLLTVSILHYNVLEWQWKRLNWAARTLQATFRCRRSRRLQRSLFQVMRQSSNAPATSSRISSLRAMSSDGGEPSSGGEEMHAGDGGGKAKSSPDSTSGTGNYITALKGGTQYTQSVVTLRAVYKLPALAWGAARDTLHAVAGSEYFLVSVTALKLSVRVNLVSPHSPAPSC